MIVPAALMTPGYVLEPQQLLHRRGTAMSGVLNNPLGLFSDPADAGRIIVDGDRTGQHELSLLIMNYCYSSPEMGHDLLL
jgi:hypothetical protein